MSSYMDHAAVEVMLRHKLARALTAEDETATRQALNRTRAALHEHEKRMRDDETGTPSEYDQ